MKIETRYNVGDKVWFKWYQDKAFSGEIIRIDCVSDTPRIFWVKYSVYSQEFKTICVEGEELFTTRKEVIAKIKSELIEKAKNIT